MSKRILSVPLQDVEWVRLYIGKCRKTLAQAMAESGADYALNGGLWNADGSPCPLLKADGEMLSKAPWTAYGYGWETGPDIELASHHKFSPNFISCTCLIGPWGPVEKPGYGSAMGGRRGRSAIGVKDGCLMLYCTGDGTSDAATPEELRDELNAAGWESAVMLDGGGSSQCDFGDGGKIVSSRKVHNIILVKRKRKEDKPVSKYTVCLDPGHGPGSVNGSPDGAYKEHEFAWDMGQRVKAHLERCGVNVVMTKEEEGYPTLTGRAQVSNKAKADCFVSLHSNAAGNDGWYTARGFLIYTSQGPLTANRNKLAAAIIDRASRAGVIVRGSGVAHQYYTVLTETAAPAVLIEYGFHTNKDDVALLKDPAYRATLAQATARGVCDYLGAGWAAPAPERPVTDRQRVQERFGLEDKTMDYLEAYQFGQDLLAKLAGGK